jgi:hypothetical protein
MSKNGTCYIWVWLPYLKFDHFVELCYFELYHPDIFEISVLTRVLVESDKHLRFIIQKGLLLNVEWSEMSMDMK